MNTSDNQAELNSTIIGIVAAASIIVVVALLVCIVSVFGGSSSKASLGDGVSQTAIDQSLQTGGNQIAGTLMTQRNSDAAAGDDGSEAAGADDAALPPNLESSGKRGSTLTEAEAYKELVSYLNKAGDYDKRIAQCASDFNNTYLEPAVTKRSQKAQVTTTLRNEINTQWNKLEGLNFPFWSKNVEAWKNLITLYEYLWHRIDDIDAAWQVSLTYGNLDDLGKDDVELDAYTSSEAAQAVLNPLTNKDSTASSASSGPSSSSSSASSSSSGSSSSKDMSEADKKAEEERKAKEEAEKKAAEEERKKQEREQKLKEAHEKAIEEYKAAVLEPIKKNQKSDGVSIYYAQYKELYPKIVIAKP